MVEPPSPICWCGAVAADAIGPHYRRCPACGTAVVAVMPEPAHFAVADDARDFYGKAYWLDYQKDRDFPDIDARARRDLSERCLFWLARVLEVVRPPGRFLEIGCGHGGFVSLMRELGFDATGTELSPWVMDFARRTFDVSVLLGPLEKLELEPGFRCIAAFDVLEHLPDPLDTVARCGRLLAEDGVLVLQTPCYRGEGPDWSMFQEREHVYLFTESSVRRLLERAGFADVAVRSSLFPYDMWVVAARGRLGGRDPADSAAGNAELPAAFRALLDLNADADALRRKLAESEADRAARLAVIHELEDRLARIKATPLWRLYSRLRSLRPGAP